MATRRPAILLRALAASPAAAGRSPSIRLLEGLGPLAVAALALCLPALAQEPTLPAPPPRDLVGQRVRLLGRLGHHNGEPRAYLLLRLQPHHVQRDLSDAVALRFRTVPSTLPVGAYVAVRGTVARFGFRALVDVERVERLSLDQLTRLLPPARRRGDWRPTPEELERLVGLQSWRALASLYQRVPGWFAARRAALAARLAARLEQTSSGTSAGRMLRLLQHVDRALTERTIDGGLVRWADRTLAVCLREAEPVDPALVARFLSPRHPETSIAAAVRLRKLAHATRPRLQPADEPTPRREWRAWWTHATPRLVATRGALIADFATTWDRQQGARRLGGGWVAPLRVAVESQTGRGGFRRPPGPRRTSAWLTLCIRNPGAHALALPPFELTVHDGDRRWAVAARWRTRDQRDWDGSAPPGSTWLVASGPVAAFVERCDRLRLTARVEGQHLQLNLPVRLQTVP